LQNDADINHNRSNRIASICNNFMVMIKKLANDSNQFDKDQVRTS